MSNYQKGFAPIYIIILILIIGVIGGSYFFGKTAYLKLHCPLGIITNNECERNWASPLSSIQPSITPVPTITTKTNETANQKTYQNNELKYEFQFPSDWSEIQGESDSKTPSGIQRLVNGKAWIVETGFISQAQLNLMGVTYCGGSPEGKIRCETKQINENLNANIDWGPEYNNRADVNIVYPSGGLITITLQPVIPETKSILNQILSTFKFLDQKPVINNSKSCQQNSDCALLMCSGCFNMDWIKTAPPDLPCAQYYGYRCECQNNKCTEVK